MSAQKRANGCKFATFAKNNHHRSMRCRIFLACLLLSACTASAGIVEKVRIALMQNNFSAAEAELNAYRNQRGRDAEYLDAYSWLARAALETRQYDQASAYQKQTKALVLEQLKQRPLDAEPHLPLALGAALEVQLEGVLGRREGPLTAL